MKAVIDEDLHKSFATVLASLDFSVFDIRDHGLRGSDDSEVFAYAQKQKAVLFSADLGFSNIVRFPLGSHHGIVILRFANEMPTSYINKQVAKFLSKLTHEDYQGNCIIISPEKLRIRRYKKPE